MEKYEYEVGDPQKLLSELLGISRGLPTDSKEREPASWAEIYAEIGKLQERSEHLRALKSKEFFPPAGGLGGGTINVCGGSPITPLQTK